MTPGEAAERASHAEAWGRTRAALYYPPRQAAEAAVGWDSMYEAERNSAEVTYRRTNQGRDAVERALGRALWRKT